jgi:hypothetical protein
MGSKLFKNVQKTAERTNLVKGDCITCYLC